MKRLSRNYEPHNQILIDNAISDIYYRNDGDWVAELDGAGYITGNSDDVSRELIEDIEARVARDKGETMSEEEIIELMSNLDFEF